MGLLLKNFLTTPVTLAVIADDHLNDTVGGCDSYLLDTYVMPLLNSVTDGDFGDIQSLSKLAFCNGTVAI